MTVFDNLAFPLRNRGVPEAEVRPRVREIAAMLDLEASLPNAGVGAHRRRQAEDLARPRTGALRRAGDPVRRAADRDRPAPQVAAAQQAEGAAPARRPTMIYVTHDQTEALTFADQVVVMLDGQVVQSGTPVELFERPRAHLRRPLHRLAGHESVLPCEIDGRRRARPYRRHRVAHSLGARGRRRGRRSRSACGPSLSASPTPGLPVRVRAVSDVGALPHRRDAARRPC